MTIGTDIPAAVAAVGLHTSGQTDQRMHKNVSLTPISSHRHTTIVRNCYIHLSLTFGTILKDWQSLNKTKKCGVFLLNNCINDIIEKSVKYSYSSSGKGMSQNKLCLAIQI